MGTQTKFKPVTNPDYYCPKCGRGKIEYSVWTSYDEAYDDYEYKCLSCGHYWWIDGCDS